VIASSVVQKSYSVNYPGEFGGGVINLTTRSAPREPFLTIGASIGGDTETTFNLGYTYYGSDTDFTGFDDGTRDIPRGLQDAINSGRPVLIGANFSEEEVKASPRACRTPTPPSSSATATSRPMSASTSVPARLSRWASSRSGSSSAPATATIGRPGEAVSKPPPESPRWAAPDTLNPDIDYRFLSTENRLLVNALLGFGYEFGEHQLRWTNLYIRDTLKEARIQNGINLVNVGSLPVNIGNTAWFERQLIDTQLVTELDFGALDFDARASYASPSVNRRTSARSATVSTAASTTSSTICAPTASLRASPSATLPTMSMARRRRLLRPPVGIDLRASAGYAFLKKIAAPAAATSVTPRSTSAIEVAQQRPDFLLSDFNVYNFDIVLTDISGTAGAANTSGSARPCRLFPA
jgi:hypothetical protein